MATESEKHYLLSSSPDLAGIQKSINKYFYCKTDSWKVSEDLTITGPKGVYGGMVIKPTVKNGVVTRYRLMAIRGVYS